MKIWIDTKTGTWGAAEDIVLVDLTERAEQDIGGGADPDHDDVSLLAFLDGASDREIIAYGKTYGAKP